MKLLISLPFFERNSITVPNPSLKINHIGVFRRSPEGHSQIRTRIKFRNQTFSLKSSAVALRGFAPSSDFETFLDKSADSSSNSHHSFKYDLMVKGAV